MDTLGSTPLSPVLLSTDGESDFIYLIFDLFYQHLNSPLLSASLLRPTCPCLCACECVCLCNPAHTSCDSSAADPCRSSRSSGHSLVYQHRGPRETTVRRQAGRHLWPFHHMAVKRALPKNHLPPARSCSDPFCRPAPTQDEGVALMCLTVRFLLPRHCCSQWFPLSRICIGRKRKVTCSCQNGLITQACLSPAPRWFIAPEH